MDSVPLSLPGLTANTPPHKPSWASVLSVWLPALVILAGIALRITLLGVDMRLHPDEALFAAQARLASHGGDVLLRETDLDKPPLTIYTTALSFRLLGTSEFAARLPNTLFSVLSLAVLYALAHALYTDRSVATLATVLWALSPYDLAFAATVFTDVQATFWVLVGALFAARDRWWAAGFALGLVFASKTNGMVFLPLVLALGIARHARHDWRVWDVVRRVRNLLIPLVMVIGTVTLWDAARHPRSYWDLNVARNNPGRLVRAAELWPRLDDWAHWLHYMTGSAVVNVALLAGGGLWLVWGLRTRKRGTALDWLLAGFGVAFMGWYWLVALNTYDRYLHTLTPFALVLAAQIVWGVASTLGDRLPGSQSVVQIGVVGLVVVLMLPGIMPVLRGEAEIGGDQHQHDGIDALAEYLNTELSGAVIYDHWLGWELAYYLGESSRVTLVYMPLPEALADDVAAQSAIRYFVAPSEQHAAPWIAELERRNIAVTTIYTAEFVVYQIGLGTTTSTHLYSG
ncbi:MAG: phospholipid carrier-dependent glycosyltransferase [Chloroflexi bacterium]|nr:phospholipid carrier-dependent glycosyltransferase [Chloroflexota bacterium]